MLVMWRKETKFATIRARSNASLARLRHCPINKFTALYSFVFFSAVVARIEDEEDEGD